jgi:hypothetical protein
MNALAIFLELVRGNFVRSHPFRIRMAPGAGRGDLSRINRRFRIAHLTDVVNAVTARACRDIFVPTRTAHAVDAGLVFRILIHTHLRIETAHVIEVRVASRAQCRDFSLAGRDDARAAAMAVRTRQPTLVVNILLKKFVHTLRLLGHRCKHRRFQIPG